MNQAQSSQQAAPEAACCPYYHEAVELIGRRWNGAILRVLVANGALRFSEISAAIPSLSDRLLSQRMKQLEARGLVVRTVADERPVRVTYSLSEMGAALAPTLIELEVWANRWLREPSANGSAPARRVTPSGEASAHTRR